MELGRFEDAWGEGLVARPGRSPAGRALAGAVLLWALAACDSSSEEVSGAGPGADAAAAGDAAPGDAAAGGTDAAPNGRAGDQDTAPGTCGPTPPPCFARPFGGCCMQDQTTPAVCGDAGWACAQDGASLMEDCPDFCPSDTPSP